MKKIILIFIFTMLTFAFAHAAWVIDEGFEGTWPPADWTIMNSPNTSNDISQSSTEAYSGSYSVRFSSYYSGAPYDQYLITPEVSTVDGDVVSFWYRRYSSGTEKFQVGWSSTGTAVATDFTWGPEISDASTTWQQYVKTDLPVGTKYVAIHYYSNYQYYFYVDEFLLGEPDPVPVMVITETSHDFGMINQGDIDTWDVTIKNEGYGTLYFNGATVNAPFSVIYPDSIAPFSEDEATIEVNATINGIYNDVLEFHTNAIEDSTIDLSATIVGTNYVFEGFEETKFPPFGWEDPSEYWARFIGEAYEGQGFARCSWYHDHDAILMTPRLEITGGDFMVFFWRNDNLYEAKDTDVIMGDTLWVEISNNYLDPDPTWDIIGMFTSTAPMDEYEEAFVIIPDAYIGDDAKIRFRHRSELNSESRGIGLDNIMMPAPHLPVNFSVDPYYASEYGAAETNLELTFDVQNLGVQADKYIIFVQDSSAIRYDKRDIEDFDNNDGGWVASADWDPVGDWEWTNTYDVNNFVQGEYVSVPPESAHSGEGFWGTVINGPYTDSDANSYLSKTVDFSNVTDAYLTFWYWSDVNGTYDYCNITVNGDILLTIDTRPPTAWEFADLDLSAYDGMDNVQIVFDFHASSVVAYGGLYIDDLSIPGSGGGPGPGPTGWPVTVSPPFLELAPDEVGTFTATVAIPGDAAVEKGQLTPLLVYSREDNSITHQTLISALCHPKDPYEPNDAIVDATPWSYGDMTEGAQIYFNSDYRDQDIDIYEFSGLEGDIILCDFILPPDETEFDGAIKLVDSDLIELAFADAWGSGGSEQLKYRLPYDDTYYLILGKWDNILDDAAKKDAGRGENTCYYGMTLELIPSPEVAVSPDSIQVGIVANGETASVNMYVENIGVEGCDNLAYNIEVVYPGIDILINESFEGGVLPAGWSQEYLVGTTDWTFEDGGYSGNPSSAHSGNYNALLFYNSSDPNVTALITPELDLGDNTNCILDFWHTQKKWSSDQDTLNIYYKNSNTGPWTLLESYTEDIPTWTKSVITLPNPSSTYYIAFEGIAAYGYGICIDDVVVSTGAPWCSIEPIAGTIEQGIAQTCAVTCDETGLTEAGIYEADIVIHNNALLYGASDVVIPLKFFYQVGAQGLQGTVVFDGTGLPLEGVKVTVGNYVTYTDSVGFYEITDIASGVYDVTFEKDGFLTHTSYGIYVSPNWTTLLNLRMMFDGPAPLNFVATSGNNCIQLTWDPPETGGGGGGGIETILVVDDDGSNGDSDALCVRKDGKRQSRYVEIRTYYTDALDALGYDYDIFEVPYNENGPDAAYMSAYDLVIWFTGETWSSDYCVTLSDTDESNLASYLDNGGLLFLDAQDYLWNRYPSAGSFSAGQFPYDYLGLQSTSQDEWIDADYYWTGGHNLGISGTFTSGMDFDFYEVFEGSSGLCADKLVSSWTGILETTNNPGIHSIAGSNVVFTTFTFGGLVNGTSPSTRSDLMEGIINQLADIDRGFDLVGYNLYREDIGILAKNLPLTPQSFTDEMVAVNSEYTYWTRAIYSEGIGAESNHDSAVPYNIEIEDFEADDGGFVGTGLWQWGAPTSGPGSAHSGDKLWATNLAGDYDMNANYTLDTPEIELLFSQFTFWHWYNIEDGTNHYDGGNVKISTDGGATWTIIVPEGGYPADAAYSTNAGIPGEPCFTGESGSWTLAVFDVSDYYGLTVKFRFQFGSDGSVVRPGWYIDDVSVALGLAPNYGALEGTVTDGDGNLLENVAVTAENAEYTVYTDEDGYYLIDPMMVGTYDIQYYKAGYTEILRYDVVIDSGVTTVLDVALGNPSMEIAPTLINEMVPVGGTLQRTITVTNNGDAPLDWAATIENKTDLKSIMLENSYWGPSSPSEIAEVDPNSQTHTPPITEEAWDTMFNYDVSTITGGTGIVGVEFGNGVFLAAEWGYESGTYRSVFKLDVEGNLLGSWEPTWAPSTAGLRDMAYDGEYFYAGTASTTIYQFDEDGNLHGTISSPVNVRSIAYDSENDAFWVNNWDDDMKLVDRTGTVLNTISSPPSMYGSAYDNISDGGPYLWFFTGTASGTVVCQVEQYSLTDMSLTGLSHTVSNDFGDGSAGGLFTSGDIVPGKWILGGLKQGTPQVLFGYELCPYATWITIDPNSGNVDPNGGTQDVTVTFDAGGDPAGTIHTCDVVFASPQVASPVSVSVTIMIGDPQYGDLSGTVTDANTDGPIEGAMITVYNGANDPYVEYSGTDGSYLIEDIYVGTYAVDCTADGYNPQTVNGVTIEDGQVTPQDFALTAPVMVVDPMAFNVTVPPDTVKTSYITIENNGNGPLSYTVNLYDNGKTLTDYSNCSTNGTLCCSQDVTSTGHGISHGFNADKTRDEVTLHYDGENDDNGIGLVDGGTFAVAARFTSTELGSYYGLYDITDVQIFIYQSATSVILKVWEGGSSSNPGSEVYSQDVTSQIVVGWNTLNLSTSIPLLSDNEYWVGYEVTNAAGMLPAGVDAGPAIDAKGDWIYFNGSWNELQTYTSGGVPLDYNWNIRMVIGQGSAPWITVGPPTSGVIEPGNNVRIPVTFNTAGLSLGEIKIADVEIISDPDVGATTIPITMNVDNVSVGEIVVKETKLFGNFPNPILNTTTFSFSLKDRSHVKLSVYNVRGQLVQTLLDTELDPDPDHKVEWNAIANGKVLANGIYFYKLETNKKTFLKKMILMK